MADSSEKPVGARAKDPMGRTSAANRARKEGNGKEGKAGGGAGESGAARRSARGAAKQTVIT